MKSYIFNNIKVPISRSWKEDVKELMGKKLGLRPDEFQWILHRRSTDLRKGRRDFVLKVEIQTERPLGKKLLSREKGAPYVESQYVYPSAPPMDRPVIVGAGPAGLIAAYSLALRGTGPLIFERGKKVEERVKDVDRFWKEGILDPHSNIQFGEGGAGAFSDGKLTSRSKDPRINEVLRIFTAHGGPEELLYVHKPHIGTDLLRKVLVRLRGEIERHGGEFRFEEEVLDIQVSDGAVTGVVTREGTFFASTVILATGHSARDLFYTLSKKVAMENKPFAVGFRIEHPQWMINEVQYKKDALLEEILGAADYHLTRSFPEENRGTYTFCMCPGGLVVGAASEPGRLCVNGMSYHARNEKNANAAVLITVDERDYGRELLGGVAFQRKLEEKAFALGGGGYRAPVQSVLGFLGKEGPILTEPSYLPGTVPGDLTGIFSPALTEKLREGLLGMEEKFPGFAGPLATLTAVESRSSSPVRILRNQEMESLNIKGLYPIGEGAGYAGGIMSAGVDGLKVAEILGGKG